MGPIHYVRLELRFNSFSSTDVPNLRFPRHTRCLWGIPDNSPALCLAHLLIVSSEPPKIKNAHNGRFVMGRMTGLEPATFGTTNQRSNQLSYIRHTESFFGGADRTRTDDPLHAMQVLYQLSYNPMQGIILY